MAGYIQQEVDRINSLITRFLDFARPQHLRLEKGDLHACWIASSSRFDREKSGAARRRFASSRTIRPTFRRCAFDAELLERVFY